MRQAGFSFLIAVALSNANVHAQQRGEVAKPPVAQPSDFWQQIKTNLQGSASKDYFEAMEGAFLPGGVGGVNGFHGTVVAIRPGELVLIMPNSTEPDVTIKLTGKADQFLESIGLGAQVVFAGDVSAFKPKPFMLTFEAGAGDGSGSEFMAVEPDGHSAPLPPIPIVRSSVKRSTNTLVTLDDLPRHLIKVGTNDRDKEIVAVRLRRVLMAADWDNNPRASQASIAVQVDGIQSTVTMSHSDAIQDGAWIVAGPDPATETSLVVLGSDGMVRQIVTAIQRISVFEGR